MIRYEYKKEKSGIHIIEKELRYWKPKQGSYIILINLGEKPKISERIFSKTGAKRMFAEYPIEVMNEYGETARYIWPIPIAGVKRSGGLITIVVWKNSQRGSALKEIAEKYGYQLHLLVVEVIRDRKNKLNTKYIIKHSPKCLCLKNKWINKFLENDKSEVKDYE